MNIDDDFDDALTKVNDMLTKRRRDGHALMDGEKEAVAKILHLAKCYLNTEISAEASRLAGSPRGKRFVDRILAKNIYGDWMAEHIIKLATIINIGALDRDGSWKESTCDVAKVAAEWRMVRDQVK